MGRGKVPQVANPMIGKIPINIPLGNGQKDF